MTGPHHGRVPAHRAAGALDADVVVFATGYRPRDPLDLLGGMSSYCVSDDAGKPLVGRDYRLVTTADATVGLYAPGATEHAHGISSTLLSNVAVRAGEILQSVVSKTGEPVGAKAALEA